MYKSPILIRIKQGGDFKYFSGLKDQVKNKIVEAYKDRPDINSEIRIFVQQPVSYEAWDHIYLIYHFIPGLYHNA